MTDASANQPDLNAVDVGSLRAQWERLAGEVGRDLSSGNAVTVARSMEQLANLEAYIALVERHRHARRSKWRRWEFWRRIILVGSFFATIALLFMAFTHPSRVTARFDLRATSIVFNSRGELRLPIGGRFETLTVTGLDRAVIPIATGERIIEHRELMLTTDRTSGGRLDWLQIAPASNVRLQASGREIGIRVSAEPIPGSAYPIAKMPAVRFTANPGVHLSASTALDEFSEPDIALGAPGMSAAVEGACVNFPARMEVTILRTPDQDGGRGAGPLHLSRFTGTEVSRLACVHDDVVSGTSRSTLIRGEVRFPGIEVPPIELEEGANLTIRDLSATLVRVEIDDDGVRAVFEGEVSDILAGRDEQRSLLPSRLEHLFARRFRMYTAGVLLYALVFIIALLKGEKTSISEGFQYRSLMKMVHGGGHL